MKEENRLANYDRFGKSLVWSFPEKIRYEDAAHCNQVFQHINIKDIKMFVFDLGNTEHVHSSMIGFLIIMKKMLMSLDIEPVFIFSEYMEKITKTLYCFEWLMGVAD